MHIFLELSVLSLCSNEDISVFTFVQLVKPKVVQLCPALFDPMDCSLPGSSVHGILQARIAEGVVIPFSRGSSQPRD